MLFVPNFDPKVGTTNTVQIPIELRRLSLEYNDHNHADTCRIGAAWRDTGVDPRVLSAARVQVYVGEADVNNNWTPTRNDLRFVGSMIRPSRSAGEEQPFDVDLEFHDYTSFFLNQRNFSPEGIPALTDTLSQAWAKICDYVGYYDVAQKRIVSSVSDLKDRIVFEGGAADLPLTGAPKRFQGSTAAEIGKLGHVQVKHGADAWAVWNQCCGMLGLITFIRLDQVVVTTALDYYSNDDPPVFRWGEYILRWNEGGDATRAHKGVAITSFDPLKHTILESFYPPPGDPRIVARRSSAKAAKSAQDDVQSENYEPFEVPGITDQGALDAIAQRVYEEYSRQAIEGTFVTSQMEIERVSGADASIFDLAAGSAIRIVFKDDERAFLAQQPSTNGRIRYLLDRGYTPAVARLIANNFDAIAALGDVYHVKATRIEFETDEDDGTFEAEITYCNVITPGGTTS